MTKLNIEDYYNEIDQAATVAAPLFNMFGWTYSNGIPTHNELVDTITGLVDRTLERAEKTDFDGATSTSSGRFSVGFTEYEEERELTIDLNLASKSQFKEWQ